MSDSAGGDLSAIWDIIEGRKGLLAKYGYRAVSARSELSED